MSTRVRIGRSVFVLVPASDVAAKPHHPAAARRVVERMAANEPQRLERFLDRGQHLGLRPEAADPTAVAAELLHDATLTVVHMRQPTTPVDTPTIRNLIDPQVDPRDGPVVPPRTDPTPRTQDTWISFSVVDSDGTPVEGTFRCSIDGDVHDGALTEAAERYEPLPEGASAQLYLEALRWPAEPNKPDSPGGSDDPVVVDPRVEPGDGPFDGPGGHEPTPPTEGFVEMEIVDEAGEPIQGAQWTLHLGDGGTRDGITDGTGRVRVDDVSAADECSVTLVLPAPERA